MLVVRLRALASFKLAVCVEIFTRLWTKIKSSASNRFWRNDWWYGSVLLRGRPSSFALQIFRSDRSLQHDMEDIHAFLFLASLAAPSGRSFNLPRNRGRTNEGANTGGRSEDNRRHRRPEGRARACPEKRGTGSTAQRRGRGKCFCNRAPDFFCWARCNLVRSTLIRF